MTLFIVTHYYHNHFSLGHPPLIYFPAQCADLKCDCISFKYAELSVDHHNVYPYIDKVIAVIIT